MENENNPFDAQEFIKRLHNLSQEVLVDMIVEARQQQKALKQQEGLLTEALKGKTTPPLASSPEPWDGRKIQGTTPSHALQVRVVKQERFDTKGFKAAHPDIAQKFTKTLVFTQLISTDSTDAAEAND